MIALRIERLLGTDADTALAVVKLGLLLLAGGLGLLLALRPAGRRRPLELPVIGLLAMAAVAAGGVYFGFGRLIAGSFIHHHDMAHYLFGSKYAPEVGYTDLYRCIVIADAEILAEDGREMPREMRTFLIRELTDNSLRRLEQIVADPADQARCRQRFSPDRWVLFKRDIRAWHVVQNHDNLYDRCGDLGYNGSPVWTTVARSIGRYVPIERPWMVGLAWFDIGLLLIGFGLIGRAYGAAAGLIGLIFYIAVPFNHQHFIHGSFLRYDWMAACLGSLAAMRLGRYGWSGGLLAYAVLVRLFPAALLLGPLALAVRSVARRGGFDRRWIAFFGWFCAVCIGLTGAALIDLGPDYFAGYLRKLSLHSTVVSTTRVGLPYLAMLWNGQTLLGLSLDGQRIAIGALVVLSVAPLLVAAMLRLEDDEALALGCVPVFLTSGITTYYGVVLALIVPPLAARRGRLSFAVGLAAVAATAIVHWALYLSGVPGQVQNGWATLMVSCAAAVFCALVLLESSAAASLCRRAGEALSASVRARPRLAAVAGLTLALFAIGVGLRIWLANRLPAGSDWLAAVDRAREAGFEPGSDPAVVVPLTAMRTWPAGTVQEVRFADPEAVCEPWFGHARVWFFDGSGRFDPATCGDRPGTVEPDRVNVSSGPFGRTVAISSLSFGDGLNRMTDFEALMDGALVSIVGSGGDRRSCPVERPGRFVCSGGDWGWVGRSTMRFIGIDRPAIWAHPQPGVLEITFPQVELGAGISIGCGLSDFAVSLPGGAPVRLELAVQQDGLGSIVIANRPGWQWRFFSTDRLAGSRRNLTLRISSDTIGRRHFGFAGGIVGRE